MVSLKCGGMIKALVLGTSTVHSHVYVKNLGLFLLSELGFNLCWSEDLPSAFAMVVSRGSCLRSAVPRLASVCETQYDVNSPMR